MKLHQLTIENYGVYASRQLDFGNGDLQMVFGPNEAGKSTMLQLVRELLFGFPHQSAFAFADHSGKMAASVQASLADGRRLSFRRQKGRSNTVSGAFADGGESIDEQTLAGLLDGAGSDLYDHVFGFSLQELSAGEQSLQHANLNEALYGGGIGGLAGFQRVRESVRAQHSALFTARGKKPTINALLSDIRSSTKQLKACALRPADYEERLARLEAQQQRATELQQQLADLRVQQHRLKRLAESMHLQAELTVTQDQLNDLPAPESFPASGSDKLSDTCNRLSQQQQRSDQQQAELDRVQEQQAEVSCAPELLDHASVVAGLIEDVRRMTEFEQSIPRLQQQIDEQQRLLQSGLTDLNPDWSAEDIRTVRPTLVQRSEIESLKADFDQLEQQQRLSEAKRPDLQRQIAAARQQLDNLPDLNRLPALEDLMQRSQDYLSDRRRLEELQSDLSDQQSKLQQLVRKLAFAGLQIDTVSSSDQPKRKRATKKQSASAAEVSTASTAADIRDAEDLLDRSVPRPETVEEFANRLLQANSDLADSEKTQTDLQLELADTQRRLQKECLDAGVVTRDQLLEKRQQRDTTWQQLKAHHVLHKPSADTPAADDLDKLTAEADRLADDRQQNAETVARQEQLSEAIDRLQQHLQQTEQQIAAHRGTQQTLQQQWQALWQPANIIPESPAAMQQWLQHRDQLLEQHGEHTRLAVRAAALQNDVSQFEEELCRIVPTADASAGSSLVAGREELDQLKAARADRQRLNSELPDLEARLTVLHEDIEGQTQAQAAWHQRWQHALAACHLPQTWSPSVAARALQQLEDLHQTHAQLQQATEQIEHHQTALKAFSEAVAEIVQQVAPDLKDVSALTGIRELSSRIDQARSAQQEQDALKREYSLLSRQIAETRKQRDQLQSTKQQLLEAAGVASEEEFYQLAEIVEQRRKLLDRIDQLQTNLQTALAVDGADDLLSELQSTSVDQIQAQQAQVQVELTSADEAYRDAVAAAAVLKRELEEREQDSRYAELTSDVESLHSQLGSAVDQWAPLVLMEALMEKALKNFEQNHQPEMVASVSDLFRRLTHNRYQAIRRSVDGGRQLSVIDGAGREKNPGELSTGTREQLYLAIRLAFVLQYCRTHEPLPIVMDDVLVNFDRQRTRETLTVLQELSAQVQIIFLTCHDHMIHVAHEIGLTDDPLTITDVQPVSGTATTVQTQPATSNAAAPPGRQRKAKRSEDDQPDLFTAAE